jgi:hypothetical protein
LQLTKDGTIITIVPRVVLDGASKVLEFRQTSSENALKVL